MNQFDIRPDKIILSGLKSLTDFSLNLLEIKTQAKGRGEIAFVGEQKIDEVRTQLYEYNEASVKTNEQLKDFAFFNTRDAKKTYWLNLHGLHEVEFIQALAETLSLDRITIRQTLDTTYRPKVEEHDHYLFFSIKSILKDNNGRLDVEHLSFVLGENYVVSFQEKVGDHFDHIRNKIEEKLGLLRKKGADFLLYQLLDAILDNYFETIDFFNDEIQVIEKIVLKDPTQDSLVKLEQLKQMAEMVKKSLNPFKEAIRVLQNRKTAFIQEGNTKYFHDLANSCLSAIEEIESTTKSLEGLTNIYFSSLSQKMNETMKVLTTVATIFIPLTFIAGVYGMNFENMPELGYKYGYFITWGVMGAVFVGMVIYFKRKKWL